MTRVIQYYDENFNLTSNKHKICWMLNMKIIDEDTDIQRLYEIPAKTLKEYVSYKKEIIGGNYYRIYNNRINFEVENALINNRNIGMTVRNDYGILEISVRNQNDDYEGIHNIYKLTGRKISEELWYKDRLIKDYYSYKKTDIIEKKVVEYLDERLNIAKERKNAIFKRKCFTYTIKIGNINHEINLQKVYYLKTKKMIEKKTMDNGVLYGLREIYDKNGNVLLRGSYLNGKKIGLWYEYENGKVVFKASFDEKERLCGLCKEYNSDGKILAEEVYVEGNLIKRIEKLERI